MHLKHGGTPKRSGFLLVSITNRPKKGVNKETYTIPSDLEGPHFLASVYLEDLQRIRALHALGLSPHLAWCCSSCELSKVLNAPENSTSEKVSTYAGSPRSSPFLEEIGRHSLGTGGVPVWLAFDRKFAAKQPGFHNVLHVDVVVFESCLRGHTHSRHRTIVDGRIGGGGRFHDHGWGKRGGGGGGGGRSIPVDLHHCRVWST